MGINVTKNGIYKDDRISLEEIGGFSAARLGVLDLALAGVEKGLYLASDEDLDLSNLFRSYGNFLGRQVTVFQGTQRWSAIAKEVLPDGRLLLDDGSGLRAVLPEEISVRFDATSD